ncbi:MAG: cation:proton antiporter [Proteobacteria bacterium]|nr:cation:proton antiporter [Pseudomonadota bacterium]
MEPLLKSYRKLPVFSVYLVMLLVAGIAFYFINLKGQLLISPTQNLPSVVSDQAHAQMNSLIQILLALSVVIITAQAMGAFFHLLGQPLVIGEVVGGIVLGPSLLGKYFPQIQETVLPVSSLPFLGIIAQLGVVFYMFVVGLELDLKILKKSGHTTLAISHASIIFPFVLGTFLALHIYKELSLPEVSFTNFALFLGVSLSVTAFPVLARILSDKKINKTRMGTLALTCAAIDDVTAWCLLAMVVSVSQNAFGGAIKTITLTFLYIAGMFLIGGPLVKRLIPWLEKFDRITEGGIAAFFIALLLSALATELIGIHAIFGAFLLGAITPHDSRIAKELTDRMEDLVRIVFLPAFFAFTGMRTEINLLSSTSDWQLCGLIIAVATLGKFGGTFLAARINGLSWRDSSALGILMNTRGLVELIVLNLGLDLRIISPRLFTMLVMMALITTFATSPIFSFLTRKAPWKD